VLVAVLGICYPISQALYTPQDPDAARNVLAAWCSLIYFVCIVGDCLVHALASGFLLYNNESLSDFISPSKREERWRERQAANAARAAAAAQARAAAAADAPPLETTDACIAEITDTSSSSDQVNGGFTVPPYLRDPWNVFSAVIIGIAAIT
jgi:hypothetical protein